jgi:hypothetical protein
MSIMRILKILFYSAIFLIPPWLFFGKGMKQVYEATEYVCIYSLYAVLILGYIVYFIEGWKAMPKKARIYWVLYYHVVKIPLFLLFYFVYLIFLTWQSIEIYGLPSDIH